MAKDLVKEVRSVLEDERGYDLDSEFWTDDITSLFHEIVEVTKTVIENTI